MGTVRFHRLLVANRGEIALRVMRTARRMGLETIAVYSEPDRNTLHAVYADQACCLGGAAAAESYLNIDALLAAARATGAEAIHPGYGFLSEDAGFAAAVENAGLVFVGPSAEAIALMGNKAAAKVRMKAAGVPCIPGFQDRDLRSDEDLLAAAADIGYPLMVKAAAGGGGRGMRLVAGPDAFLAAVQSARSEALSAFGSSELIFERAISGARHVEVQVFADRHGNVVHLGERDCSVQRRHQKVIEESPCPAVDDATRARMGAAATAAARSIGYEGAGTLEFLLDASGEFYFMEMNTRLQVEHAVTEMRTGLDLVEWQLRVARGEALPRTQGQLQFRGHAMEVRVCAEDPGANFLPQTGEVLLWHPPSEVRVDSAIRRGLRISPYYDSMLGKIVAYGDTRAECIDRLARACGEAVLLGVDHNLAFLRQCLRHERFTAGEATTAFIPECFPPAARRPSTPAPAAMAAAAILFAGTATGEGWTNARGVAAPVLLEWGRPGQDLPPIECRIAMQREGVMVAVRFGAKCLHELCVACIVSDETRLAFEADGIRHAFDFARDRQGELWLQDQGRPLRFRKRAIALRRAGDAREQPPTVLRAPFAGRVLSVAKAPGASVHAGEAILVLESMKMEHALHAPVAGTLAHLNCTTGDQVAAGQTLAKLIAAA